MRRLLVAVMFLVSIAGCSGKPSEGGGHQAKRPGGSAGHGGGHGGGPGDSGARGGEPTSAVPVEVAPVMRRSISSFIETNGTLEAENEVDLVARVTAPIISMKVEEGDRVKRGQVLALLEPGEYRADLEIAKVELNEARLASARADLLKKEDLISPENYEQAVSDFDAARARVNAGQIQLDYTEIRAPFDGLIIARYVKQAQQVRPDMPMLRISDFDPLLCPVQVPERDLRKLRVGQRAYVTVEPYPLERFEATVLRISPVINPATGTIKVTLQVSSPERLRPGMFTRVFIEDATRADTLVIPKAALSLESIGDTVFVVAGDLAARREVKLGFREGDFVEVLIGIAEGESVVVVGQDGLGDGTPIEVLQPATAAR